MAKYTLFSKVIIRTATESFTNYPDSGPSLLNSNFPFRIALFLANQSFYERLRVKDFTWERLEDREKNTVMRYYNRFCHRATPFGIFAGVGLTSWGGNGRLFIDQGACKSVIFPDQEVALAVSKRQFGFKEDSLLQLNPTLNRDYRYVRATQGNGAIYQFSLESMPGNRLLSFVVSLLKQAPLKASKVIQNITTFILTSYEEAVDYVEFLLEAHIIQGSLALNITGTDYYSRVLKLMSSLPEIPDLASSDSAVMDSNLFDLTIQNLSACSLEFDHLLAGWNSHALKSNFYSGLNLGKLSGGLSNEWEGVAGNAVRVAALLHQSQENNDLAEFRRRFLKKYEQRKVPLLEVLDPHVGIGYLDYDGQVESGLIQDIDFGTSKRTDSLVHWSGAHKLLMEKWTKIGNSQEIDLSEADLDKFEDQTDIVPQIISVMFRLIEGDRMQIDSIGSGFGALIGRYTIWSDDFLGFAKELAGLEQSDDIIYAELLQLSGSHVDNINRRGQIYDYEIPINAISLLPPDKQIKLSDLVVSVQKDQIILECIVNRKRIIPRLSSAFNYTLNQLPLFRFLCDLQFQGQQAVVSPDLSSLFPGLSFYPRLTFGKVIFSPATWNLDQEQIAAVVKALQDPDPEIFELLQLSYQWPEIIALSRHDQQLVFYLTLDSDRFLLSNSLKGLHQASLSEYFLPADRFAVHNERGSSLVSQYVSFFYQERLSSVLPSSIVPKRSYRQKDHPLGSQWLYLKLYCNPAAANRVLSDNIAPALQALKERTSFKWFFIRYNEGGYHIRLRLQLKGEYIGIAIRLFKKFMGNDLMQVIKEYQADTYKPEWERYGSYLTSVETFFFHSSEAVLALLPQEEIASDDHFYRDYGLLTTDAIITCFFPDLEGQLSFIKAVTGSLSSEFNSLSLKKDMDNKYRTIRSQVSALLQRESSLAMPFKKGSGYQKLIRSVTNLSRRSHSDEARRSQLLADLVHMHLNRLFMSRQRESELLIYYCLLKYKGSLHAMLRNTS